MIHIDQLKKLREETGISISECKKALEKTSGNFEKAKGLLHEWGKAVVKNKLQRETLQGIIDSYIHPNKKVGVLLELQCETDFVAKSSDFQKLAHELCLHIAGFPPDNTPLLEQLWIKDPSRKIQDLIEECITKLGENIILKQFARFEL